MTRKVDEFVQINGIDVVKHDLKDSNYVLLEALNKTNVIKELVYEKEEAIKLAKELSKSLQPEIQLLSTYIRNEEPPEQEEIYTHKKKRKTTKTKAKTTRTRTKTKTRTRAKPRAKGKQVNLKSESHTLTELKKNLAKLKRQLNE